MDTRIVAAMDYICTNFRVDSSSCFPFRDTHTDTWTHTHTHTHT